MFTFPLVFPAPSAAALAFVNNKAGDRITFIRMWRKEVAIVRDNVCAVPSLRFCMDYYAALLKGLPAMDVVIMDASSLDCSRADLG